MNPVIIRSISRVLLGKPDDNERNCDYTPKGVANELVVYCGGNSLCAAAMALYAALIVT